MSGMGRDAHGHPCGGDERPHQLRRPVDPSMDELSKRMNNVDPFASDYGRYSYNPQQGQHPQMVQPPRPAPNADGWSSGENHFGQQMARQQQQQHYQFGQQMAPSASSGWNPTASEFVPKSNLSASAMVFVPRQMPRNTSWAYQQQHHQDVHHQVQEQLLYQEDPSQPNYQQNVQGCDYAYRPQATSSHHRGQPSGGHGHHQQQQQQQHHHRQPAPSQDCTYDPTDALTDAVATLVLMPHKFERTSMQLAEKINNSVSDLKTLTNLADLLVDTCLKKKDFRSMAGKFCNYLAGNVTVSFDGITFKHRLLDKYQNLHGEHVQLLSSDSNRCRSLLVFATDLYLQLNDEDVPADSTARSQLLASRVHQLFMSFLTLGKQDERNLATVADMLKLSGDHLENDEMRSTGATENMDRVMGAIRDVASDDRMAEQTRSAFNRLHELRASGWRLLPGEKPSVFDVQETNPTGGGGGGGGRTKGSNAIAIVAPPPPPPPPLPEPMRSVKNNAKAAPPVAAAATTTTKSGRLPPEDHELTEEELRFMSEQLGEDNFSESDGNNGFDSNGVSDAGSDMPEEVEAAFREFLKEQQQQQQQRQTDK